MGLLTTVAFVAVSLIASRLLLRPPKGKIGNKEFEPSTRASRGSWIPLLLGTREIEPVVAFVGDRIIVQESNGGKGLGGGSTGKSNVYYESAMHILSIGPNSELLAILQDGKIIWEGPIKSETTPSGTRIDIGIRGKFTIYWGEIDQPINDALADPKRIGIASRWPYICYVWWFRKRLSSAPFWPRLTYIVRNSAPACSPLLGSSQWLLQEVDGEIVQGLNPAHALAQLLTAEYPHGAAIPNEVIDRDSLESFGVLAETEHLPINMLISEGPEFSRPVQTILQDMGVFLVQDGPFLLHRPLREETGTIPVLNDDVISPPNMERDIIHGDLDTSQIIFLYSDETNYKYKDVDIKFDEDGENLELGRVSIRDERIDSVTHNSVANKIARRRMQELNAQGNIKLSALRGARLLQAGQVFSVKDFGVLRVISQTISDDTAEVNLEVTPDVYGIPDIDDRQGRGGGGEGSSPLPAELDAAVTWFELPPDISSEIAIVVMRIRSHQQIVGSVIWGSGDGVNYVQLPNQDYSGQGGILEESLASATGDIIAAGPIFEALSDDMEFVLDLSSDELSWQQGRQLAAINGEIFYLQSVSAIAENEWTPNTAYSPGDPVRPTDLFRPTGRRYVCTVGGISSGLEPDWPSDAGDLVVDGTVTWETRRFRYRPNNLIRARYSTVKENHSIGDVLFITDSSELIQITHPIFLPGLNLCIKSQPFTDSDLVDLASIAPVCKTLTGDALGTVILIAGTPDEASVPIITSTGTLISLKV